MTYSNGSLGFSDNPCTIAMVSFPHSLFLSRIVLIENAGFLHNSFQSQGLSGNF